TAAGSSPSARPPPGPSSPRAKGDASVRHEAGPTGSSPRATRPVWWPASSRDGTIPRPPTSCSSRPWPDVSSPRWRTTPRPTRATCGTSSGTPPCSCPHGEESSASSASAQGLVALPEHLLLVRERTEVVELLRVVHREDPRDATRPDVEDHGAEDTVVAVAEDGAGGAVELPGVDRVTDADERGDVDRQGPGQILLAEGRGSRPGATAAVADHLHLGGQQVTQGLDVALPERTEEPPRELVALLPV